MDYLADFEEIRRGETTDIYFRRTLEVLKSRGMDRAHVSAEIFLKRLPGGYDWGVFAGLADAANILEGRGIGVKALPEGSIFFPEEPVMVIEGPYGEFGEMETAVLGLLCQSSGIATKSARVKDAAGEKQVLSFGARRMHPTLAAFIDRNAYIGGVDGVSVVLSAKKLGIDPSGTIPHALILIAGDTLEGMRAFDEALSPGVKRICLIDTFQDEKFEAVRVAEEFGDRLFAVRLDTPSSRRGDFRKIIEEVRWELDIRGHGHIRIFVSGGLSEEDIVSLRDEVDGFGVGTCISNAPVLDFSLDIVEIEGRKVAKRGKMSGSKEVIECGTCNSRYVVLSGGGKSCPCGGDTVAQFKEFVREGKIFGLPEDLEKVRGRVKKGINRFRRGKNEH